MVLLFCTIFLLNLNQELYGVPVPCAKGHEECGLREFGLGLLVVSSRRTSSIFIVRWVYRRVFALSKSLRRSRCQKCLVRACACFHEVFVHYISRLKQTRWQIHRRWSKQEMNRHERFRIFDKFLKGWEFMTASTWQTKVYKVSSLSLLDPINL